MIGTPMSPLVREHFGKTLITERYLLTTPFTMADLYRIAKGEGTEAQARVYNKLKMQDSHTSYKDILKNSGTELKKNPFMY